MIRLDKNVHVKFRIEYVRVTIRIGIMCSDRLSMVEFQWLSYFLLDDDVIEH